MTGTGRAYHHGDLRAALLRAAERAVESVGGEGLSLRELSRELGVSSTAPRRHFRNKQALLDSLSVEGFERLGRALGGALEGDGAEAGGGVEERLVALARAHVRFALAHPRLLRLMFAAKHHAEATAGLLEASYRALAPGPAVIEAGQRVGTVVEGDPEQLALTVFAAVEGLVALSTDGEVGGEPLDRLVEVVVRQIMVGLQPRGCGQRKLESGRNEAGGAGV